MKRLFFAFLISPEIKSAISALGKELKMKMENVRWSDPDTVHMTLLFLGETDESLLPRIDAAATELAQAYEAPVFELLSLSAFPDSKNPKVIIVGCTQKKGGDMPALSGELRRLAVVDWGIENNMKPWIPHLTMGRARGKVEAVPEMGIPRLSFQADKLYLMESFLSPRGARHEIVSEYAFVQR